MDRRAREIFLGEGRVLISTVTRGPLHGVAFIPQEPHPIGEVRPEMKGAELDVTRSDVTIVWCQTPESAAILADVVEHVHPAPAPASRPPLPAACCPQCGPCDKCDEDGCCVSCGSTLAEWSDIEKWFAAVHARDTEPSTKPELPISHAASDFVADAMVVDVKQVEWLHADALALFRVNSNLRDSISIEIADRERARQELRDRQARDSGEVWYWEDDGDNHPESLVCPVMVSPDTVRKWVAAEASLQEANTVRKTLYRGLKVLVGTVIELVDGRHAGALQVDLERDCIDNAACIHVSLGDDAVTFVMGADGGYDALDKFMGTAQSCGVRVSREARS